jgi:hypothetical protein
MPLSVKVGGSWTEVGEVYVKVSGTWQKVAETIPLDDANDRNFRGFTSSGSMTVPLWATKMYYVIIAGGRPTNGNNGGNGGQVLQGNTAVIGGTSLTISIGGANADSSIAISGGSTFTAVAGSGAAANGTNGTITSAPFITAQYGGAGGRGFGENLGGNGWGGLGGGGKGGGAAPIMGTISPQAGHPNTGGGAGGLSAFGGTSTTGGSGRVLLYFS